MISVTWLSAYEYCARKFFLEHVLKLVEVPREVLVRGSVMHEIFESIAKQEESLVKGITRKISFHQLFDKYRQASSEAVMTVLINHKPELREFEISIPEYYNELLPLSLLQAEERALNAFRFMVQKKAYAESLWQVLFPKIIPEPDLKSELLQLRGRLDQIHEYPDKIIPYEFKTGSAPGNGVWPGHKLQMGSYLMILKEQHPELSEGIVKYLDAREDRSVMLNPFLEERVLKLRDEVLALLNEKEIPDLAENRNKCMRCQLREKCHDEKFIKQRLREAK